MLLAPVWNTASRAGEVPENQRASALIHQALPNPQSHSVAEVRVGPDAICLLEAFGITPRSILFGIGHLLSMRPCLATILSARALMSSTGIGRGRTLSSHVCQRRLPHKGERHITHRATCCQVPGMTVCVKRLTTKRSYNTTYRT